MLFIVKNEWEWSTNIHRDSVARAVVQAELQPQVRQLQQPLLRHLNKVLQLPERKLTRIPCVWIVATSVVLEHVGPVVGARCPAGEAVLTVSVIETSALVVAALDVAALTTMVNIPVPLVAA